MPVVHDKRSLLGQFLPHLRRGVRRERGVDVRPHIRDPRVEPEELKSEA